jgi:hypothetical protein
MNVAKKINQERVNIVKSAEMRGRKRVIGLITTTTGEGFFRRAGGFSMRGMAFRFMIGALLLALGAFAVRLAVADDETENVKIKIKAPLDAVDCLSTPATIILLGLTIDISHATLDGDDDDEDGAVFTCADLTVGRVVEASLASDIGPLSALKLEADDEECDDEDCVEVEAPIQAIDPTAGTITVLGLVVDVSQANLGANEEDDDEEITGGKPPIDLTQLIVGQFVEMKLASNQPPLVATELEVKNINNGVEIDLVDSKGNEVEDDDDDVDIQVTVTATVAPNAPAGARSARTAKVPTKVFKFHARSNGRIILNGLPTGSAKIVVTRIHSGSKGTGKSSANIQANTTQQLRVKLRHSR